MSHVRAAAASVLAAPPGAPTPPPPAPAAPATAFAPDANLARAQVPDAFKWDLGPLFRDGAAFDAAVKQAFGK